MRNFSLEALHGFLNIALICFVIYVEGTTVSSVCGKLCRCFDSGSDYIVLCKHANLIKILRNIPPNTTVLILTDNRIAEISAEDLYRTSNLRVLDISGNLLQELGDDLFNTTSKLEYLNISRNLLQELDSTLFRNTPNLLVLDVISNMLAKIPQGIFNSTPGIQQIKLSDNYLTEAPKNLFLAVEELRYLDMSGNEIDFIDKDLFSHVHLVNETDFSNNSISRIPDGLFSSYQKPHELRLLFFQRNKLSYIQKGAFDGLPSLLILCLFDNEIRTIDSGAFSLRSLVKLFLFKNNLKKIANSSFANSSLQEIHLYGNDIENISKGATEGLPSDPVWFLSCELLRNIKVSNIQIECVSQKFTPGLRVERLVAERLTTEGFTCEQQTKDEAHCELCERGMYTIGDNNCYPCPRGGFYQDEIGFKSLSAHEVGCKKCNEGTFVRFGEGKSAKDCEVCPPGTNKSMPAGFHACFCKDGYARYDRFGPCYPCNQTGLNCSGLQDYQSVMKGYYWFWKYPGANNDKYREFAKNLLDETKDFDNNTSYDMETPRVFKCPRPESCNTNQSGDAPVLGTCSKGYSGWLCNKCSRGYYSLLKKCVKCPTIVILIIEALVTVAFSLAVCFIILTQYVKHKKRNVDERNLWDIIVSRIKIILGFYQVLAELFFSLREVHWVEMFDFMAEILSFIRLNVLRILFRPHCFHDSLYVNPRKEFLIALSVIFCLTAVPLFFYNIKKVYLYLTVGSENCRSKLQLLKAKISTVCLMLLFVTYPPICTAIFQIYHGACVEFCSDLKNENCMKVLRSDFGIYCKDLVAHRVFVYFTTAAYTVAFPVTLFFLLRKYCSPVRITTRVNSGMVNEGAQPLLSYTCDDMNIPVELRFLCENYKPQFWYWEIVELTRKVTQTALLTLLGWDDKMTVLMTIGVSVLFLTAHARYMPMKSVLEQRLQIFSLSAILINVLVAAMSMTAPDGSEQRLAVILFLLNMSVFIILIAEGVLGVIVQLKRLKFYRRIYDPKRRQQKTAKETVN